jgi:PPOX class probable F420-dependent enzyme
MIDLSTEFGRVVERHLNSEYIIWLTTVDSRFTPQPRPVWFIWDGNSILIFSMPGAHKVRHIEKHPNVALHFNTDATGEKHVIVMTGEASIDSGCPPASEVPAYLEKYRTGIADLSMTPESFSADYSAAIRISLSELRGWE